MHRSANVPSEICTPGTIPIPFVTTVPNYSKDEVIFMTEKGMYSKGTVPVLTGFRRFRFRNSGLKDRFVF
jgi:hypothetical protein